MTARLFPILALAALPAAAATPPPAATPLPAYVWLHPAKDEGEMTLVFDARHKKIDYKELVGFRTGYMPRSVDRATMAAVLDVLTRAETQGSAGCDTIASLSGQAVIWKITLIDTTATGKTRVRSTTRASLESIRCRAREAFVASRPLDTPYDRPHDTPYDPPHDTPHDNPLRGLRAALEGLSLVGPHFTVQKDLPVMTSSRLYMYRLGERNRLVADARAARSDRQWDRVAFDVWTARIRDGRGVRLATSEMRGLADDPGAPTSIRVRPAVLQSVIAEFLGRTSIEIASILPREKALRNGISGYVAAVEMRPNAVGPAPVFAADLIPADADALAREIVAFLESRDRDAAVRMRAALALGSKPAPVPTAPDLTPTGPVPIAIFLAPTTGEDFVNPLLSVDADDSRRPQRFTRLGRVSADHEFALRGIHEGIASSPRARAVATALLEQAVLGEPDPCDPISHRAQWPPNWVVRIYDSATDSTAHVAREFTVSARAVRCRALAAYDALGRGGDREARKVLERLSQLGFNRFAPAEGSPQPPERLPPDDARADLLAFARGPAGVPRTKRLAASFWAFLPGRGPRAAARFAVSGVSPAANQPQDMVIRPIDETTFRSLLVAALSDASVAAGARRARSTFVPDALHAEFRVLEHHDGMSNAQPVFVAYLSREEGMALAKKLERVLGERDKRAARAMEWPHDFLRDRGDLQSP